MSERFQFKKTPLNGVLTAERKVLVDNRGSFSRLFCIEEFKEIPLRKPVVQMNHSVTKLKGSVRGLHFQIPPHAETKIITCLKGEAFDVAVDLRRGSPTFLSWHGETLSAENRKSIIIPEGFAHGFQTLSDDCELIYLHTEFYTPQAEQGLSVTDERIAVKWPLPITHISDRDKGYGPMSQDFFGVVV